jgi:hypothetical protein
MGHSRNDVPCRVSRNEALMQICKYSKGVNVFSKCRVQGFRIAAIAATQDNRRRPGFLQIR